MHDVFGPYCVLLHVKREKLVQDGYTTRTLLINLAATRVAAGLRLGFSHRSSRVEPVYYIRRNACHAPYLSATTAGAWPHEVTRPSRAQFRCARRRGRSSGLPLCASAEHSWRAWSGSDDTVRGTRLRRRGSASGAMEYCFFPERVSDSRSITREVDLPHTLAPRLRLIAV